ncbi:MAG: hypothetical protein ACSHWY_08175 [Octadecabacter sp.]
MYIKAATAVVLLTAMASPAIAQGFSFSGGELTIDSYVYDDADSTTSVDYSAALEFSLSRNMSVAFDLAQYDFSLLDESVTTFTVHSIYHLNDTASLGFLAGNDFGDNGVGSFYGIEGGFEANQFNGEGYVAFYDNDDNSSVIGLSGSYQITESIAAIGDFGYGNVGDADITRISAGAEYDFAGGPTVYAEIGNLAAEGENASFIGLGATVQFGAQRGTTFDRRSIFETLIPGF